MCRIGGARSRADPHSTLRFQCEFVSAQMCGVAMRIHERSRRIGIDRTVFAANVEQHQFAVVLELDAHPVPSHLIGLELVREKFMVHPRRAYHLKLSAAQLDFALSIQPRERNVMRRVSRPFGFLADAVLSVRDWRLCRSQREMQCKALVDGLQDLLVVAPRNLPVAVPDSPVPLAYAGDTGACAVSALRMKKFAAVQIA